MTETPGEAGLDVDGDRLREECGVFGIFRARRCGCDHRARLHALQHRGQEAAGIVSFDGKRFHSERRLGLVGDNFSRREVIERLPGLSAMATCATRPPERPFAQRAAAVRGARRRRICDWP